MIWLCLILLVLLCKGLAVKLAPQYPENTLFVEDENNTATISCISNLTLKNGSVISWFKSTHKIGEPAQLIISCLSDTTVAKYECDIVKGSKGRLKVHDVQSEDSGVYYYVLLIRSKMIVSDRITLIVRQNYVSSGSIYLLTPAQTPHDNGTVQLACFVQKAPHWIFIRWNISGAYFMGSLSSTNTPDGTWSFLNYISLPADSWNQSGVACEVWFGTSFVKLHWKMSEKATTVSSGTKHLQMFSFCLRFALVVCTLLALVIFVHLSSIYI